MLGAKKRPQTTYDSDLILKADYQTAAAAATTFGADALGGTAYVVDIGTGLFRGVAIIDVSAIVVGADEIVHLTIQGGNDAAFTVNAPLATLSIGDAANIVGLSADSTPGRYKLYFDNEYNGTYFQFIRLQIQQVEGTARWTGSCYVGVVQ